MDFFVLAVQPGFTICLKNKYILFLSFTCLLLAHISSFLSVPLNSFYPDKVESTQKISSTPPERRSLHARGYLATFFLELVTGYIWRMQNIVMPMSKDINIKKLPLLPYTDKIVFIQIESLDYELLHLKVNNEYIMPYLHNISKNAIVLRLQGSKKMATANSEYEVLTGRIASYAVLHFEYEKDYSDSIISKITNKISPSCFFHGVPKNYMNRDVAYRKQGIEHIYTNEAMKKEGVRELSIWKNGVILDADMFNFAKKKIPHEGSFFHFIVTVDMHLIDSLEEFLPTIYFNDTPRAEFFSLCRNTDNALRDYIEQLPNDTTVVLWGDHRSYTQEASGDTPFIFFIKGRKNHYTNNSKYTRSEMYHYINKNLSNITYVDSK